jgi:hypothetical protein
MMPERPDIWLLARGEDPIAELVVEQLDRPWVRGRVVPWDGFTSLFDRDQRFAARVAEAPGPWAHAYQELRGEVRLIRPDGREVPNFLLHIEGRRASWRCSDRRSVTWRADQLRVANQRNSSGGPAIGPGPVGLAGSAGSATPGDLSADGTSFAVTLEEAQTPAGPAPIAAASLPRHAHRAPGVQHTPPLWEGW